MESTGYLIGFRVGLCQLDLRQVLCQDFADSLKKFFKSNKIGILSGDWQKSEAFEVLKNTFSCSCFLSMIAFSFLSITWNAFKGSEKKTVSSFSFQKQFSICSVFCSLLREKWCCCHSNWKRETQRDRETSLLTWQSEHEHWATGMEMSFLWF